MADSFKCIVCKNGSVLFCEENGFREIMERARLDVADSCNKFVRIEISGWRMDSYQIIESGVLPDWFIERETELNEKIKGILMRLYPLREKYEGMTAQAKNRYDDDMGPAKKVYDRAMEDADNEYGRFMEKAIREYDEATTQAGSAYYEETAITRLAYRAALDKGMEPPEPGTTPAAGPPEGILLMFRALQEYQKDTMEAKKTFNKIMMEARKQYQASRAQATTRYLETADLVSKVFDETVSDMKRVYDEAIHETREAYRLRLAQVEGYVSL